MKRTLSRLRTAACACALAYAFACAFQPDATAQTRDASKTKGATAGTKGRRAGGAEARAARERKLAAALIAEVAGGAGEIEDPSARASVLTDSADALWPVDEATARALFRRAWEAATAADEAAHAEEGGVERLRYDTLARREVAVAAAKRDRRLADEFLEALRVWMEKSAEESEGDDSGGAGSRRGPRRCDETTAEGQRLALAGSLLAEGAHEAAAEVAAPAARCGADADLVLFLLRLRPHAPERADALFLRLLAAIRADAGAGPNSALVPATYVVTPGLMAAVDESGAVRYLNVAAPPGGAAPERTVSAQVRASFYDTAAQVLLRPSPPAGANVEAPSANSPAASYQAVSRLLPFFEREAPRHASALHARRAALAADIQPARREMIERQAAVRRLTSENSTDPLRPLLDAIGRESDPSVRDELRLGAAHAAAKRKFWERARRLAEEIADDGKRRAALFVIAARQVAALPEAYAEAETDDAERAVAFVRRADLPPALRALGLAQAAQLAARRRDRARSLELLDEALNHATQADGDKTVRTAAALMAAEHAARLDSPRRWEALAASVFAVNSDEDFSGTGVIFDARPGAAMSPAEAETLDEVFGEYSLDGLFEEAAREDFARATAQARALRDGLTRSLSLVAAARAVIERRESARGGAR
jgi:hypothetical protein